MPRQSSAAPRSSSRSAGRAPSARTSRTTAAQRRPSGACRPGAGPAGSESAGVRRGAQGRGAQATSVPIRSTPRGERDRPRRQASASCRLARKAGGRRGRPRQGFGGPPVGLAFDDFRTNVHDSFLIVLEIRGKGGEVSRWLERVRRRSSTSCASLSIHSIVRLA